MSPKNQHWVNGSSNALMTVWLRSDGARAERSRVTSSTITLYTPDFEQKVKAIGAEDKKKTDAMHKF